MIRLSMYDIMEFDDLWHCSTFLRATTGVAIGIPGTTKNMTSSVPQPSVYVSIEKRVTPGHHNSNNDINKGKRKRRYCLESILCVLQLSIWYTRYCHY